MTHQFKFTLFGIIAIFCWSALLAVARLAMEQLGPATGSALIYTLATLLLGRVIGFPSLSKIKLNYLLCAGVLFVSYEILLALSLGYADSRLQTVQVSIVNYLWPALTVWFATFGQQKIKHPLFLYLALLTAFVGVALTLVTDIKQGLFSLVTSIESNPTVFIMVFSGALIWAVYCNFTKKHSDQPNLISYFFLFTALSLWVKVAFSDEPPLTFSALLNPMVLLSAILVATGYGLWNVAIVKGNFMLLATLSYFTPISSALLSSILLTTTLPAQFWPGVLLVTLGSLLCWKVTRTKKHAP